MVSPDWRLVARNLLEQNEQLARDVLAIAEAAEMPNSFRQTDSRVLRAKEVLGLDRDDVGPWGPEAA